MDLFAHAAKLDRDAALSRVAANAEPWTEQALKAISRSHMPATFTGEDIRRLVTDAIGSPHHPNAFGALVNLAVRRGMIAKTGQWTAMTGPKSHARQTPLYRKVTP